MKKPMTIMLLCVGLLFLIVAGWKYFVHIEIKKMEKKNQMMLQTVSAVYAKEEPWQPEIKVVGSARTVKGVSVTTQLAGMITDILFTPGSFVTKNQLLVKLNTAPDVAKLHDLQANANIASITYHRDQKQFSVGGVSKQTLDQDKANNEATHALVAEQKALIEEKMIRAPFTGKLGISLVDPGQYVNPGDKVVTLQTISPIYIDFFLPQQDIKTVKIDQNVSVQIDTFPHQTFVGKITTINPIVDDNIRNIEVEATLANKQKKILPGMFAYVIIKTGKPTERVTLPQNAISFNPYGSIAYILKKTKQKHNDKTVYQVTQQFVTTGDLRGNQIAITKGLKANDYVVSAGQLKVHNHSYVIINNKTQPLGNADPKIPQDE